MNPADAALWENGMERPIRRHFAESPIIGIADVKIAGSIKCNLIRIVQLSRCRRAICAGSADPGTGNRNWTVTRRDFQNLDSYRDWLCKARRPYSPPLQ